MIANTLSMSLPFQQYHYFAPCTEQGLQTLEFHIYMVMLLWWGPCSVKQETLLQCQIEYKWRSLVLLHHVCLSCSCFVPKTYILGAICLGTRTIKATDKTKTFISWYSQIWKMCLEVQCCSQTSSFWQYKAVIRELSHRDGLEGPAMQTNKVFWIWPCSSFHHVFHRRIWWWHQQKCSLLEYTLWVNHWTNLYVWHKKLTTIDIPTKILIQIEKLFYTEQMISYFPFFWLTLYIFYFSLHYYSLYSLLYHPLLFLNLQGKHLTHNNP